MKEPAIISPLNIIDVETAIQNLESDLDKSVNALCLYKTDGTQIMLITLKSQAELKRHSAPGPISVQVLKGAISFRTDEIAQELSIGQLLTLEANVPHSVVATDARAFLVTKSMR